MRAFVIPHPGSTDLELAEVPIPKLGDDELLVRVHAVGVGIHDSYFLPQDAHYPYPIGIEAAGVVEKVGGAVTGHTPGDRIAFVSSMQAKGGTWAEYVAVSARALIIPLPRNLDFVRAAALPVAGNTILKAFHALRSVPAGATVFLAGGSGAIGTLAIQAARARGWRIGASASASNHAYMHSLGAEKTVDYHDPNWVEQVLQWAPGGVDAAVAIQPATSGASVAVVKDSGTLITISGDPLLSERGIQMAGIPYQADIRDELVRFMADVATGETHVEIEHVYPFDEAAAALAKVQTRRARGKVILRLP